LTVNKLSSIEEIETHRCFDGVFGVYAHKSEVCDATMRFSVYQPPQAIEGKRPVLYYLAGLTCTEQTFMIKGGALRLAAKHGLILVAPDTSPRDTGLPGEDDDWDFGTGAGFYVDANQAPWSKHYRMYSYVTEELPGLVSLHFSGDSQRQSIFGHSMGGHGALVCALRNPNKYHSVSAFAPVCAPIQCPWGQKAFSHYLGEDKSTWAAYDASELVQQQQTLSPILIDIGLDDSFLHEQLNPGRLEKACQKSGQKLILRKHKGYDHSYFFISTFMEDHITHHAQRLTALS